MAGPVSTSVPTLILPAAGLGTRMRAVDPSRPKELLPLAGRPLIQHALIQGMLAGVRTVVVVLRPGKEMIRRYIEEPFTQRTLFPRAWAEMDRLGTRLRIEFTVQDEADGECGAILSAREACGDEPFAVLYPDNVFAGRDRLDRGALEGLVAGFRRAASPDGASPDGALHLLGLMCLGPEQAGTVSDSGRVELGPGPVPDWPELAEIRTFAPKGNGSFAPGQPGEPRACGLYLALPEYFEAIERARPRGRGEELTDGQVRRFMQEQGARFFGLPLPGPVFDAGNPAGYQACRAFLEPGANSKKYVIR